MADQKLLELWNLIAGNLTKAAVSAGLTDVGDFREYLENNELELAWDTLFESFSTEWPEPLGRDFWVKMADVADLMELPAKAAKARSRIT